MPLYHAIYTRNGAEHEMVFAARDDAQAQAWAENVLSGLVGCPIERVEPAGNSLVRAQRTAWEKENENQS